MDNEDNVSDALLDNCQDHMREHTFESDEMQMATFAAGDVPGNPVKTEPSYSSGKLFPPWILADPVFNLTRSAERERCIADVFRLPPQERTQEQLNLAIKWLHEVWHVAQKLGWKRCSVMAGVMIYSCVKAGHEIIREGEVGCTFYIVLSGELLMEKHGESIVETLYPGQSFGELSLTTGEEAHSATITARTKAELLSLNKAGYENFVKDIQDAERQEALRCLAECSMFQGWSRSKLDKVCSMCQRAAVEKGKYIFRQGDAPTHIYFVLEGVVHIVKEVAILSSNRWPASYGSWEKVVRKSVRRLLIGEVVKPMYFGELAIMRDATRLASARAKTRVLLLSLDKLEFVHMLKQSTTLEKVSSVAMSYAEEEPVIKTCHTLLRSQNGLQAKGEEAQQQQDNLQLERLSLYGWAYDSRGTASSIHRRSDTLRQQQRAMRRASIQFALPQLNDALFEADAVDEDALSQLSVLTTCEGGELQGKRAPSSHPTERRAVRNVEAIQGAMEGARAALNTPRARARPAKRDRVRRYRGKAEFRDNLWGKIPGPLQKEILSKMHPIAQMSLVYSTQAKGSYSWLLDRKGLSGDDLLHDEDPDRDHEASGSRSGRASKSSTSSPSASRTHGSGASDSVSRQRIRRTLSDGAQSTHDQ